MEEIQAIEEGSSEEDNEKDGSTLATVDVGEFLLIKRSPHAQGFLMTIAKENKPLTQGAQLEVRFVV